MDTFKELSKQWIQSRVEDSDNVFALGEQEDSDNRLNFTATVSTLDKTFSFSVTCPDTSDAEKHDEHWSVWSDDPTLHTELQSICDFCDSERQKTITDILNRMEISLNKVALTANEESDDEDYDDNNDYYGNNTDDDPDDHVPDKDSDEDDDQETFFGSGASPAAFQRLAKDMRNMKREGSKFSIEGNPRGENLFIWDVKLTDIPTDTPLGKDVMAWSEKYKREPVVYLEMQFPSEYPMAPPFVRVTRPRFKFLTGHVTIGGSICMQMLTKSGWTPTNDIESILVQIRSEILSDKNTRLDSNPDREYGEVEARDAFRRMVERYKW